MSNLSQFAPFAGGGLKSYQTGYVSGTTTSGSGEDARYVDVTVSSVNTAKTICSFDGGGINGALSGAMSYYSGGSEMAIFAARMTSSTNVRIANGRGNNWPSNVAGRWQIAEAN